MQHTISLCDPQGWASRKVGLSSRQLLAIARKLGWRTEKVGGRKWIAVEDYERWLSATRQAEANK